jgi:undecaprenyl-diphosphatase
MTILASALIVALPVFVAWARMYRGMHHLTDSVAGVVLGLGALVVTVFAARAAGAAADRRDRIDGTDARSPSGR